LSGEQLRHTLETVDLPGSLSRLALEIEGWLDLGCAEHALRRMQPLLGTPGARPVGLMLQARAFVTQTRYAEALESLAEARTFDHDPEWLEVQEGWCRKRLDDLPGAVECMERLVRLKPRSAIGHYNLGCYLSLSGDIERAIEHVTIACGLDESFRMHAEDERDLDPLRRDARFRRLLPPKPS
jgi:tetratricopeptide (TPR) repeat protein